ncbi:hypothetical protein FCM35_KLT18805 [Carex littledalei]|uniref:Uncharacterized protein n=1 Tax=Carex littledalei TaxID=544730 RepID=A0A833R6N3_9POAL|nr:hypothetical protein FCM35_KLT18805 [Carex littledalei]
MRGHQASVIYVGRKGIGPWTVPDSLPLRPLLQPTIKRYASTANWKITMLIGALPNLEEDETDSLTRSPLVTCVWLASFLHCILIFCCIYLYDACDLLHMHKLSFAH